MSKKFFFLILFLCTFRLNGVAQQVPASVLLGNVERCATSVYMYPHNSDDREITSLADLSGTGPNELYKSTNECLAEINKALADRVAETRTVNVRLNTLNYTGNERPTAPISLAELKAMFQRIMGLTGGSFLKAKAEKAAQYPSIWMSHVTNGTLDEVQAEVAAANGKDALALIDEAIAGGLSVSEVLEIFGRKLTVAEAREEIIYVKTETEKVFAKNKAAEEAKYEPFRKVLSGDKLALYNDRMKSLYVYSTGGRILSTPQQYAGATLWCRVAIDRNGISPRWDVTCWHFRGMTQIGSPTIQTGWGETPPSSAYR